MDKMEFLKVKRSYIEMKSFLEQPDLGAKILRVLEGYTSSFQQSGIVAGQAVATAIDELLGLTSHLRYNDVDVFEVAKAKHIDNLFSWDSFVTDCIAEVVLTTYARYYRQCLLPSSTLDNLMTEFPLIREAIVGPEKSSNIFASRKRIFTLFKQVNIQQSNTFKIASELLRQQCLEEPSENKILTDGLAQMTQKRANAKAGKLGSNTLDVEHVFEVAEGRGYAHIKMLPFRKGRTAYQYSLLGVEDDNFIQHIYTSPVKMRHIETVAPRGHEAIPDFDMATRNTIVDENSTKPISSYGKVAECHEAYAHGIVCGFDVNSCAVGVDLRTGKVHYDDAYLQYLCHRQINVLCTSSPLQTVSRILSKSETTAGFVNEASQIAFMKYFLLMDLFANDYNIQETSLEMSDEILEERISRKVKDLVCNGAIDHLKGSTAGNIFIGKSSYVKCMRHPAIETHFDMVKINNRELYLPVPKQLPKFAKQAVAFSAKHQVQLEHLHLKSKLFVAMESAKPAVVERYMAAMPCRYQSGQLYFDLLNRMIKRELSNEEVRIYDNKTLAKGMKYFSEHNEMAVWFDKKPNETFLTVMTPMIDALIQKTTAIRKIWDTAVGDQVIEHNVEADVSGAMAAVVYSINSRVNGVITELISKLNGIGPQARSILQNAGIRNIALFFVSETPVIRLFQNELGCSSSFVIDFSDDAVFNRIFDMIKTELDVLCDYDTKINMPDVSGIFLQDIMAIIRGAQAGNHGKAKSRYERFMQLIREVTERACTIKIVNELFRELPTKAKVQPLPIPQVTQHIIENDPEKAELFQFITVNELLTNVELKNEGQLMSHCVGGYFETVNANQSRIIQIVDTKSEERATAEWRKNGSGKLTCVQIRAKHNREPHNLLKVVNYALIEQFNAMPADSYFLPCVTKNDDLDVDPDGEHYNARPLVVNNNDLF